MIAGIAFTDNTNVVQHAMRWTQESGLQDLNTLLSDAGVDMTGVSLNNISAISENGKYLAGIGDFPGNGQTHAALIFYDDGVGGVITPEALAETVTSSASAQSAQSFGSMTVSLNQARESADQATLITDSSGVSSGDRPLSRWSA